MSLSPSTSSWDGCTGAACAVERGNSAVHRQHSARCRAADISAILQHRGIAAADRSSATDTGAVIAAGNHCAASESLTAIRCAVTPRGAANISGPTLIDH